MLAQGLKLNENGLDGGSPLNNALRGELSSPAGDSSSVSMWLWSCKWLGNPLLVSLGLEDTVSVTPGLRDTISADKTVSVRLEGTVKVALEDTVSVSTRLGIGKNVSVWLLSFPMINLA